LRNACAQSIAVTLISDQPHLLAGHQPRAQHMVERIVSKRGIAIHLGCRVLRVEAGAAVTATDRIEADAIVWATGAGAPAWPAGSGLALDAEGFISVEASLQSVSHTDVFAAGDCASVRRQPHPKSGVYAVRQGPLLAENLRRRLENRALTAFKPQPRALALLSSADHRAIGLYGPLVFEGAWVWRWKDRIDRRFVARYRL
jgi:selenide,water dikinase